MKGTTKAWRHSRYAIWDRKQGYCRAPHHHHLRHDYDDAPWRAEDDGKSSKYDKRASARGERRAARLELIGWLR